MITFDQAQELEALTSEIHFQVLRENGNTPDDVQQLALQSIHNQLCRMCLGPDDPAYGRWYLNAPVGFGKSSAVAAFLAAAWQKKLLGNGVSITITAARVNQLYDFEDSILNAGIPADSIRQFVSVLHGNDKEARRDSDLNTSTPVLLITQEKLRRVYARPESKHQDKDPVYFLKFKGEARDFVVWDERCLITKPISIPLKQIEQALGALKACNQPEKHGELIAWLTQTLTVLRTNAREMIHSHPVNLPRHMGVEPKLPPMNLRAFLNCLSGSGLAHRPLADFLSMFQFRVRLIPVKGDEALVTFQVVVPDHMQNVLVLDGTAKTSELTKRDKTLKCLEDHHPMLMDLHRVYGKRLVDLVDYRDLQFLRWNIATGKDSVVKYLQDPSTSVMQDIVSFVKERVAEGQSVLLWTHRRSNGVADVPQLLRQVLSENGVDLHKTIPHPFNSKFGQVKQVEVESYGHHDATNKYAYMDVLILLGVPRRQPGDIAAAMLGAERQLPGKLNYKELEDTLVAESASDVQQCVGRGPSRRTLNGVAGRQTTLLVYQDTSKYQLTPLLTPLYPGSTWQDFQPKFKQVRQGEWDRIADSVATRLVELKSQGVEEISTTELKQLTGNDHLTRQVWARIIERALDRMSQGSQESTLYGQCDNLPTPWKRQGKKLVCLTAAHFAFV